MSEAVPERPAPAPAGDRPRLAESVILGAYLFVIGTGVLVHEPWFDEAQSWLLSRDASVFELLTRYLRYEGHPPLWYLILKVPASLGLPYKTINVISAAIGLTGVVLLLRNRAVPLVIRTLLPFTYFIAYQYTIISRSYVLILPLLLAILAIYPRRRERLWLFILLLALLCHVSLHAASIAGALVLVYAAELYRDGLPQGTELHRHLFAAAALLLNVAVIAWILRTPADLAIRAKLQRITPARMGAVAWHGLLTNLAGIRNQGEVIISLLMLGMLVVWFLRRRTLGTFLLLVASLLPVCSVYFNLWHEGLFFLVIVFTIVLTFLRAKQTPGSGADQRYDLAMIVVVALIMVRSVIATSRSYAFDISQPYSGSRRAAEFIKAHHIDRARLFGAGFASLAIQPYFDHNVFANYRTSGGFAFWDWSTNAPWFYRPAAILRMEDLRAWHASQIAQRPDFFLVSLKFPYEIVYSQMLRDARYEEIAAFPGGLFWKDGVIEQESFVLFAQPVPVKTPPLSPAQDAAPSRTETLRR